MWRWYHSRSLRSETHKASAWTLQQFPLRRLRQEWSSGCEPDKTHAETIASVTEGIWVSVWLMLVNGVFTVSGKTEYTPHLHPDLLSEMSDWCECLWLIWSMSLPCLACRASGRGSRWPQWWAQSRPKPGRCWWRLCAARPRGPWWPSWSWARTSTGRGCLMRKWLGDHGVRNLKNPAVKKNQNVTHQSLQRHPSGSRSPADDCSGPGSADRASTRWKDRNNLQMCGSPWSLQHLWPSGKGTLILVVDVATDTLATDMRWSLNIIWFYFFLSFVNLLNIVLKTLMNNLHITNLFFCAKHALVSLLTVFFLLLQWFLVSTQYNQQLFCVFSIFTLGSLIKVGHIPDLL